MAQARRSTAVVTDSTALLTTEMIDEFNAIVVPVTVTLDGVDHLDGVEITADGFYQRLADAAAVGGAPELATAQPSPGQFLDAYQRVANAGASDVLAVVVGSAYSATFDSARLAAEQAPLPVEVVDSGQASFGISLCLIDAVAALDAGATVAEAAGVAQARSVTIETVFIIQAIELARASGRFGGASLGDADPLAISVLKVAAGELSGLGEASSLEDAVTIMAGEVLSAGVPLRVASGLADLETQPVTSALEARLTASPLVTDLIRYRVGPGVAANTGPGTAGVFYHPI